MLSACHLILLPCDQSSGRKFWVFFRVLLQEKMHSLVMIFEADSRNSMQCSGRWHQGCTHNLFSRHFGLPRGNQNDSDVEHKGFQWFNICYFKAITVVLKLSVSMVVGSLDQWKSWTTGSRRNHMACFGYRQVYSSWCLSFSLSCWFFAPKRTVEGPCKLHKYHLVSR